MVVNSQGNPERSGGFRKFSKTLRFDFKKVLRDQGSKTSRSVTWSWNVRCFFRWTCGLVILKLDEKGLRVTPKTRESPLALMSRDLLKKILTLTRCNYVGSMSVHHPCYPCALCWLAIQWREPLFDERDFVAVWLWFLHWFWHHNCPHTGVAATSPFWFVGVHRSVAISHPPAMWC